MSTFSAKSSGYLAEEIGRRQELRDRIEILAEHMPKRLTRTTWWLLTVAAITAACMLAATQAILSARESVRMMSTEHAREVLLDEWKGIDDRCSAAFRLRNSAALSIEALQSAAKSSDPKLSTRAKAWLDQVRELVER